MSGKSRVTSDHAATKLLNSREGHTPISAKAMISIAIFSSVVLVYFAWQPLWHTDLWGHLSYGRWFSEARSLPKTEPFLPWDEDKPLVDTAWLSQWIGYSVFRAFGIGGIQLLYAGGIALAAGILAHANLRKCGSPFWGIVGAILFLMVDWEQLRIVRPQLAGLVCYSILLATVIRPPQRFDRARTTILFVAWANLHGSFVMGWLVLAAMCAGRAIEVLVESRRLRAVVADSGVRRFATLLGIAIVVTLLNPYGPSLHVEIGRVAVHPNLHDLIEWKALFEHRRQMSAFIASGLLVVAAISLAIAGETSQRRVAFGEMFILAILFVATLKTSRMILWWGPIAGWTIATVAASRWKFGQRFPVDVALHGRRNWRPMLMVATILLVAFALTPAGVAMLTGRPQRLQDAVSAQTPLGAAEYLREHPPRGLIFNPMEWGDYLVWAGPDGLEIFANSHAHLLPLDIWRDYMRVNEGSSDAIAILDRHDVEVVVTDPNRQGTLIEALRADDQWRQAFEDDRSIVFAKP